MTLLEAFDSGTVDLVTSSLTKTEIAKVKDAKLREQLGRVAALLEKVPFVDDHTVLGFQSGELGPMGGAVGPLVADDPYRVELQKIGLDRTDAHHVALAIKAKCDTFVTTDVKTIIK